MSLRRSAKSILDFCRSRSGVAAIEFAILALPFFMIVFVILESSLILMAEVTMDNAVDKMARTVRVGGGHDLTEVQFRQNFCHRVDFLFDCDRLNIDLKSYATYADVPLSPPVRNGVIDKSGFGFSIAEAETIMELRVYYAWPVHTDLVRIFLSNMQDGSHLIAGNALFKNEPF